MFRSRKLIPIVGLVGSVILASVMLGSSVFATPGPPPPPDELSIGPNATLSVVTGGGPNGENQPAAPTESFSFGLRASRVDNSILMGLNGALCTVHGPGAEVDFATEAGNTPLAAMQCGRAFGMAVHLAGCSANLEFHGFVHWDRSPRIYFGAMTTDVEFHKTGASTGTMRVTIFTPKGPIVLAGTVQSPTPIVMATCPS